MGSADELSLEQVLEQIGLTAWVTLGFHGVWNRWPRSMSEDTYLRLVDRKLVDPTEDQEFGVPNAAGIAMGKRLRADHERLVAHFEKLGHHEVADGLLRNPMFLVEPGDPEAKDPLDAIADDVGLDIENVGDPDQWAKSMRALVKNPDALRHVTKEMGHMMAFLKKAIGAVAKLPKDLDRHYRGELTAIGKDLVHDLDLGNLTEEEIHKVLMVFLQQGGDDDDDDPEPAPPQSPNTGEKVLA